MSINLSTDKNFSLRLIRPNSQWSFIHSLHCGSQCFITIQMLVNNGVTFKKKKQGNWSFAYNLTLLHRLYED